MTQIVPGLPAASLAAGTAAAGKTPALAGDAWMKQLERARWEAQPRYRAGEGAAHDSGAQQQAQPAFEPANARVAAGEALAPQARGEAAREAQSARAAPAELPVSTAAFLARAGQAQPLATAWNTTLALGERMRLELLRIARTQERGRTGEPWSERNVHVQAEGEAWAVWIRDAAITPGRVREMLDAIARIAGESGAPRAIRLTVNGQPFGAAPPSGKEPQAAGEPLGN